MSWCNPLWLLVLSPYLCEFFFYGIIDSPHGMYVYDKASKSKHNQWCHASYDLKLARKVYVLSLSSVRVKKRYNTYIVDFISWTDMMYRGNVILLILLLKSQVPEGSGYNCSDFKGYHGIQYPLVECPPAKFMLKDNLVECFDNFTRITDGYCKNRLIHV